MVKMCPITEGIKAVVDCASENTYQAYTKIAVKLLTYYLIKIMQVKRSCKHHVTYFHTNSSVRRGRKRLITGLVWYL